MQKEGRLPWECVTASAHVHTGQGRHGGRPHAEAVVGVPGKHVGAVQRDDQLGSGRYYQRRGVLFLSVHELMGG